MDAGGGGGGGGVFGGESGGFGGGGTYAGGVGSVALVAEGALADDFAVRVGFFVVLDVAGS